MAGRRSRIAFLAAILGGLGLLDIVLGPLLIKLGVLSPLNGFRYVFGVGVLEGLVALVLGLLGLFLTRSSSGAGGRNLAWFATAAGGAIVALVVMSSNPGLPPINDITTDAEDPPSFAGDPAGAGRDMAYPVGFAAQVREAYPDLAPIELAVPPAAALERATRAAESLGWTVVAVRSEAGELEASETSALFEFVDDVVVRVRPQDSGSVVDVRSKSRDGRGDLGANAARIRRFRDKLTG
jgi:uncharacterized protein (DUF1499 family)